MDAETAEKEPKPKKNKGGRPFGALSRSTIQRQLLAERVMNAAESKGIKLGRELMEEYMILYDNLAMFYRQEAIDLELSDDPADNKMAAAAEAKFEKNADKAAGLATAVAQYQSPKLAAVAVNVGGPREIVVIGGLPSLPAAAEVLTIDVAANESAIAQAPGSSDGNATDDAPGPGSGIQPAGAIQSD